MNSAPTTSKSQSHNPKRRLATPTTPIPTLPLPPPFPPPPSPDNTTTGSKFSTPAFTAVNGTLSSTGAGASSSGSTPPPAIRIDTEEELVPEAAAPPPPHTAGNTGAKTLRKSSRRNKRTGDNIGASQGGDETQADLSVRMADFVLRDLDTGETRLITDLTEPEEAPDTTAKIIRKQSQERLSKKRSRERAALAKEILKNPTKNEIPIPTRRPSGNGNSKRAYSDEMLSTQSESSRSAALVKVTAHKKRDREFAYMYRWQALDAHKGPIRVLAFSPDGRKLATAGHDMVIRVWDVDARVEDRVKIPKNPSIGNLESTAANSSTDSGTGTEPPTWVQYQYQREYLRGSKPICELRGHTAEIVDVCWSKNGFLCSGSMDKTIRLWHPTKKECLRVFWHHDFVTTVRFHPSDEQVCISGSADGSLRLWHLKEAKLLSEAKLDDIITACALTKDGSTVLVGTLHGRVKFYSLFDEIQGEWQFVHTTQLDVRSRRAKKGRGKKVAGIAFRPGGDEELCVSSSDSRLRLYRYDDKALLSKFLGHVNEESQLSASFSPCGTFVLSASENRCLCIWEVNYQRFLLKRRPHDAPNNTNNVSASPSSSTAGTASAGISSSAAAPASSSAPSIPTVQTTTTSKRKAQNAESDKGKNFSMESFDPHDNGFISAAVFAPKKAAIPGRSRKPNTGIGTGIGQPQIYSKRSFGLVLVTASEHGEIRVFGCI